MRQKRVVAAKHVLRHAVHAAEIATVGYRNAKIVQAPAAGIGDRPRCCARGKRRRPQQCFVLRCTASVGEWNDRRHTSHALFAARLKGDFSRASAAVYYGSFGEFNAYIAPVSAMPMLPLQFPLAVILQRTQLVNRWVDERWEPVAVVSEIASSSSSPIKVVDDATGTRWRFGGHSFELHP